MAGGDPGESIGEVGFPIDAVQFRGLQDGIHRGGAIAAGVATGEEPVASVDMLI
jgi:hypothetical protein